MAVLVEFGIGTSPATDLIYNSVGFRTFQRAVDIGRKRRAGRQFDVPERTALAVWQAAQGTDDEVLRVPRRHPRRFNGQRRRCGHGESD